MLTITTKLPLYALRSRFLHFMYAQTAPLYARFKGRQRPRWQVDREELIQYPPGSLGHSLGRFLVAHDLQLFPAFENHDVFHVLLDYGLSAPEEVELQWCLIGNGKRSPYAWTAALIGAACFPEYWGRHRRAYRRGRAMCRFYHWYFEYLLQEHLEEMRHYLQGGALPAEKVNF